MDGIDSITADAETGFVEVTIPYVKAGETSYFYPTQRELSYWPRDEHQVRIHDVRPIIPQLSLEKNGFVIVEEPTAVKDFYDKEEVRRVYYPEVFELVKKLTGAFRVVAFGEMTRGDAKGTSDGNLPSHGAHVDYNEDTVRRWVHDLVPDEADELLSHRFVLINLWRPIRTVERTPLAVCDASTIAREDLFPSEIRGGLGDPNRKPMGGFNVAYNPRHKWWYAPRMRPEEVLAFKLFDSDPNRVQWTGHTAFDDPSSPPDARPRESIEIRTVSFYR